MRILAALVAACLVASLAQVIIIYIVLVEVLFTSLFIFSTLSSESYVYIKKNNFLCMSLVLWSCSPFYSRFIEESNNLNHGRRNIGWPRKYYRLLWMCQSNFNIRKKLIKRVLAIKKCVVKKYKWNVLHVAADLNYWFGFAWERTCTCGKAFTVMLFITKIYINVWSMSRARHEQIRFIPESAL